MSHFPDFVHSAPPPPETCSGRATPQARSRIAWIPGFLEAHSEICESYGVKILENLDHRKETNSGLTPMLNLNELECLAYTVKGPASCLSII
jgi:hypothetical protein